MNSIHAFKHLPDATLPTKAHLNDAGLDLYSAEDVFIATGQSVVVKTGIALEIPAGAYGKVFDRSSMARKGLIIGGGVIDAGYSGSIDVVLHNLTCTESTFKNCTGVTIKKGARIAQLVLQPLLVAVPVEVTTLWGSARGENGFGSSGV